MVLIDTEAHKAIDVFYVTKGGRKLETGRAGEIGRGAAVGDRRWQGVIANYRATLASVSPVCSFCPRLSNVLLKGVFQECQLIPASSLSQIFLAGSKTGIVQFRISFRRLQV